MAKFKIVAEIIFSIGWIALCWLYASMLNARITVLHDPELNSYPYESSLHNLSIAIFIWIVAVFLYWYIKYLKVKTKIS